MKIGRRKWEGGWGWGVNSTVFMPGTLCSQHKKKRFVREIKGKDVTCTQEKR